MKSKETNKKIVYFVFIAVFICARWCLSAKLRPYIWGHGVHDDAWMIRLSYNILQGKWLGDYNQYTLIKGAFSPFFVALAYLIGVDYLNFYTICYIVSCLIFLKALSPVIKNDAIKMVILVVLLFNPLSYCEQTYQRIYRNGFSQWEILLLFASFLSIYFLRKEGWKKLIPWELLGGFSLWAVVNTREDALWAYVFAGTTTVVTLGIYFAEKKNGRLWMHRAVLMLIPFLILWTGNTVIKSLNYLNYGIYSLNDRTDGYFAEVMKCLYNIAPEKEEQEKYDSEEYQGYYINILHSSLEKAYAVSPTLNGIKSELEASIQGWENSDSYDKQDGELEMDHLLFAFRDAVKNAGYYVEGKTTEEFYKSIYTELEQGFEDGRLEKRGIVISAGCVPFQTEQIPAILKEICVSINVITGWDKVQTVVGDATGSEQNIKLFENITGDYRRNDRQAELTVTGWGFSGETDKKVVGYISDAAGNIIDTISMQESKDVYQYFQGIGSDYVNAMNARFNYKGTIENLDAGVYLDFYSSNELLAKIQLTETGAVAEFQSEDMYFNIDTLQYEMSAADKLCNYYVDRANGMIAVYAKFGNLIWWFSVILYMGLLAISIWKRRKEDICMVLVTSSILLTMLLVVAGVSYITVTTFGARHYIYLSPAYVLCLMFCCLIIGYYVQKRLDLPMGIHQKKSEERTEDAGINQK